LRVFHPDSRGVDVPESVAHAQMSIHWGPQIAKEVLDTDLDSLVTRGTRGPPLNVFWTLGADLSPVTG
jgi:hypothetical protein